MALNLLSPSQFGLNSTNLIGSFGLNSYSAYGASPYTAPAFTAGLGGISPYGFGMGGLYGANAFSNLAQDRSFTQAVQSLANGFKTLIGLAMGDLPGGDAAASEGGSGENASSADWLGQGAQALI